MASDSPIETASEHLRNALAVIQCCRDLLPHMSEQSIASHIPGDMLAVDHRIRLALDNIEIVKAHPTEERVKTWL